MKDETAPAPAAAAGKDGAPTRRERIDFLKHTISFTEWNIRSFDTKAQISIAAFVLSITPTWSIMSSACPAAGSHIAIFVLLLLFVGTILCYGFVLWPVAPTTTILPGGWESGQLFYVKDPTELTSRIYTDTLRTLSIETELAAETLKLASIRNTKSVRFKRALCATILFYGAAAIVFLLLRNC